MTTDSDVATIAIFCSQHSFLVDHDLNMTGGICPHFISALCTLTFCSFRSSLKRLVGMGYDSLGRSS